MNLLIKATFESNSYLQPIFQRINFIIQQMIEKDVHEDIQFFQESGKDISSSTSPQQYKINLINQNTKCFRKFLKLSLKISLIRLISVPLIFIFGNTFLISEKQSNLPDSWNIIFYVIACMMDFMVLLNDTTMLKALNRDQQKLLKVKSELSSNAQVETTTSIGNYTQYLSMYNIVENYKYKTAPSVSISQTVRYLHTIFTFYIFGNFAVDSQNYAEGQTFQAVILWLFIFSIYVSIFEIDTIVFQTSDGPFVERKYKNDKNEDNKSSAEVVNKTIKKRYISNCRRPFQVVFVITILALILYVGFFFKWSILNLMMLICAGAHIAELIHQRHLQNSLLDLDLNNLRFNYLHCYKILSQLASRHVIFYIIIRSITRITIILTILGYFREAGTSIIESVLFLAINVLLFMGQYVKFNQLAATKLYVLQPFAFVQNMGDIECSICLLNCQQGEQIIQLPCFSQHIYHYQCMQKWFLSRKECPLCRFSLDNYELL